jgi:hypothetical protein
MKTIKLKDILSISGKGGLYKFIAQARNGIVVESIEDKKRHVAPATARVSSLVDIAIFTHDQEVPLSDIFMMIHEKNDGKETISHKSSTDELKNNFLELVPDYDDQRVYVSDIRKVFHWYNLLHSHDLLQVIDKEEEGEEKEPGAPEGKSEAEEKSTTEEKGASKVKSEAKGKSPAKGNTAPEGKSPARGKTAPGAKTAPAKINRPPKAGAK